MESLYVNEPAPVDAALVKPPRSPSKTKFTVSVDASIVDAVSVATEPSPLWKREVELVGKVFVGADTDSTSSPDDVPDEFLLDQLLADDPVLATLASSSSVPKSPTNVSDIKTAVSPNGVPADEVGLTPLEIRRKRNRESMQRARTRQRDGIESMKVTVQQLEAQFQKLSDQKVATQDDQTEARYRALAEASRRLKEENYLLEKMLTEKYKAFRRLQQAMVDRQTECGLDPPAADPAADRRLLLSSAAHFFSPISEQQADEAIKRCYTEIVRLERVSKPLRNTATPTGPLIPPTSTFGWLMMVHLLPEENGFFVAFTKTFESATPADVMLKTWTVFSKPENNTGTENRPEAKLRMDTLQVVNENAYVASRDVQHPVCLGKTLRTVFLRFRLQTETGGFVIGRACMNPSGAELRALQELEPDVVYGDFSSWIEFRDASDGSGGCEVKFGAILAYDTQEDLQLRIVNALMTTVTWESAVIRPVFSLQDSAIES